VNGSILSNGYSRAICVQVGQQAGIFKIRKSLGEIERRNREIERHTNKETKLTIKIPSKASKLI
jgi:hypothetical protein